ncbi:MAG: phosphoribosylglycinamide formyltransferase [Synechococcus sp. Tobar2m-G35]|nr:phosphoribosylglycinamide formyltransferase [Synechococcus sp. Tobar2m-G35]
MPALADASGNSGWNDSGVCIQWPPTPPPSTQAPPPPLRLGVMASGDGSNLEALVSACRDGSLAATVVLLVVNEPSCGARRRAERLGLPCLLLDHRDQPSREALDEALVAAFQAVDADLVVMAGWMRIVTPRLINAFPQRLLNLHPSLLPSFRGRDGIGDALAAGVTLAGCTAHLVVPEVDAGPILVQAAVPVLPDDDRSRLHARIRVQEHRILPLAVRLAAERLRAAGQLPFPRSQG